VALALSLAACSGSTDSDPAPATASAAGPATTSIAPVDQTPGDEAIVAIDDDGATSVEQSQLETQLEAIPAGTLTTEEIDGLMWMREEEKLAHDVYVALYDLWQVPIFSNISRAELTHTDSVKTILDRYQLEDPAIDTPDGVFTNPDIQALYNDLVAQGSESLIEALKVGALIEDLDIFDLQALATDTPDIALLYANLEKGSRNHMRAFISNLDQRGGAYTPVYLTPDAFAEIISTPTERGPGG
jgi:hypothetical protein